MKRDNGFTLVELLAVIVVLAIILAIAVPGISGIIRNATRSAFESDAKMVLQQVEYKKLDVDNFDETQVNKSNLNNLLGLSDLNYDSIAITREENVPIITIIGTGKWDGLIACGSYKNMKVVESATDCSDDLILPVITLLGDNPVSINTGDTYSDAGATAIDNVDGDLTSSIVVTGTINPGIAGTYTITYTVSDAAGNIATATRTVNVIDVGAPTITFGTNGNTTYAKSRNTTVTISDVDGEVDNSSLKYLWNTSTTTPTEASIINSFANNATITTPVGVTGGYYLWIIAKDMAGNTTIQRSEIFNLDNTAPVITLNGTTPVNISVGGTYTDAGATATDTIDGTVTVTSTGTVDPNIAGTYTINYNAVDSSLNAATTVTRTVMVLNNFSGPGYIASKGNNGPILQAGMTPIKWNGSDWVNTDATDTDWYNYTTTDKKWANVRTADGSMWVWIPRYAYQIASGYHTSTAGAINIKFLKSNTNTASDNSTVATAPTYSGSSQTNYIVHPAFVFGTTQLTGMWVAKFEASGTTSAINILPGVETLVSVQIGDIFTATRNMETNSRYGWGTSGTNLDTHLIKNTEWGAAAYLSKSSYGKNAEVWNNPTRNTNARVVTGCAGASASAAASTTCSYYYTTTNGQQASTTGNIYGIYDMSGGTQEYTAAYVDNGNANLATRGNSLISADAKYRDVYPGATDIIGDNYASSINIPGSAVYETSSSSTGSTSWYSDNSAIPYGSNPFFTRSGGYDITTSAGIFNFYSGAGAGYSNVSFRVVLLTDAGL